MDSLAPHRRSWLAPSPVVGSPVHWAGHTALYAALVASGFCATLIGTAVANVGVRLVLETGFFLVFLVLWGGAAATAAAFGALVGAVQPMGLDRVRGRVALPLVVLGQSVVGAVLGAVVSDAILLGMAELVGWAGLGPWWQALAWTSLFGGFVGASAALAWWLPFTVATVTGGRTGRVTVAAASSVSLWLLAVWLLLA